jgi:predicted small metal-binding protein
MTFKLACGDVMPGCAARFENTAREALLADVAGHAASAHGISVLTPEVVQAVEARIVVTA